MMKVFIAEQHTKGYISPTDYHWCNDSEILMFGQFQIYNRNAIDVSMCGIETRKFTTHIIVKDMNIDKDFYKELITESVENSMKTVIGDDGKYKVEIDKFGMESDKFGMEFDINNIMDELIEKANMFDNGQKVKCVCRELFKLEKKNE